MKKFEVLNGKGENVFGGQISEDNVYLQGYAKWPEKSCHDIGVGESVPVIYSLSGSVGRYRVVRKA